MSRSLTSALQARTVALDVHAIASKLQALIPQAETLLLPRFSGQMDFPPCADHTIRRYRAFRSSQRPDDLAAGARKSRRSGDRAVCRDLPLGMRHTIPGSSRTFERSTSQSHQKIV